jgi:uncharacterized phage-associated protein
MSTHLRSAQVVADFFLANVDEEAGDNISNLKLQKLLYYAQGFHVAMHGGEPLFTEPVLAWDHGPVVEPIYHQYKWYRWQGIDRPRNFDINDYPPEVRELLGTIYRVYGQFSATRLEHITHNEPPWLNTSRNGVISLESLREFFSTLVEAGKKDQSILEEPVWPTNSFRFQRRREIMKLAPQRDRMRPILDRVPSPDPWASDSADY